MSFSRYDVQPLLWRTPEFQNKDALDEIGFMMSNRKHKDKVAKKLLKKYVNKECPLHCLFCYYVEGVSLEDDEQLFCGGQQEDVQPEDFCYLFTPDEEMYEVLK